MNSQHLPSDNRLLYTVAETADLTGLSERSIWRLIAEQHLALVKCGRAARVTAASLRAFIERGGTAR